MTDSPDQPGPTPSGSSPSGPSAADQPAARPNGARDDGTVDFTERALDSLEDAAASLRRVTETPEPVDPTRMSLLGDVNLRVRIELGRTRMYVEDVVRLAPESVIELDKAAGDPVDIFVNDRHVARGEVLVLNESFCVRVSEILTPSGAEPG